LVRFDAAATGTSVDSWSQSEHLRSLSPFDFEGISTLAVIAAHPDDETLGAGGLIAVATRRGIAVHVVVVTDGSASNPDSVVSVEEISSIRSRELRDAVGELAPTASILELAYPDGHTDAHRDDIRVRLADSIPAGAVIVCPWRGDGHRDHRIVGEVCAELAAEHGVMLLEYPIWMWHWGDPDEGDAPWQSAHAVSLSSDDMARKRRAIDGYSSQVRGLGNEAADAPVLSPDFIDHFTGDREVFFVTARGGNTSKGERYFDDLYERNPDPWRLSTRWYETRKRAISVASLPRERYRSSLEIGCSVGELSALVAGRSEHLLAIDISEAAVQTAASRTAGLGNVTVEHRDATVDFPRGAFDLIVLSEVGYYWDASTLRDMIAKLIDHLSDDGELLACHWRHPVDDYPLRGDEVHAALRARTELHRVLIHEEEDFVLEVFGSRPDSVARREGLVV
jgi:LmbE family N-acetylglucosaminyl deacetylase/protein-L-isoaspartate O-methyltransferase